MLRRLVLALATLVAAGACGSADVDSSPVGSTPTPDGAAVAEMFPDVVAVELTETGDRVFTVAATLSSPYDSPERYADAWRVLTPDGTLLGVRELLHDHAAEQPFTRMLSGVEIPVDIDTVIVEARDQASGWGGATITVAVPPS